MTASPVVLESRPDRVPEGTAAFDVVMTDVAALRAVVDTASALDVDRALGRARPSLADFAALLSPAAASRLEELAHRANEITRASFGATVRLFSPL